MKLLYGVVRMAVFIIVGPDESRALLLLFYVEILRLSYSKASFFDFYSEPRISTDRGGPDGQAQDAVHSRGSSSPRDTKPVPYSD